MSKLPDCAAVEIWRRHFKLNLNQSRKRDIEVTVIDLDLWTHVVTNWGYVKDGKWVSFNPLAVSHQLSEYERLEQKQPRHASSTKEDVW
jgi:hypothetical protein